MTDRDIVRTIELASWTPAAGAAPAGGCEALVEAGNVLYFPRLAFDPGPGNADLIVSDWADGKAKNISFRGDDVPLKGARGTAEDLQRLKAMLSRFVHCADSLVQAIFPAYAGQLRRGFMSFRTAPVEGRKTSWRKDDTRLHVDAFPSNPTGGERLLRVFSNVNPAGVPRVWRVGEAFRAHAQGFFPRATRPRPVSAWLLNVLGITKSLRTPYDHYMNQLHDLAKSDAAYQRGTAQQSIAFPAGSTWVVFSDQVPHAVMSGQYMMEQTFYLAPDRQLAPETSPLRVLEELAGRPLV